MLWALTAAQGWLLQLMLMLLTKHCMPCRHSCPHAGGGRGEAIAGIANVNIAFTTVESEREGQMHMQQLLDALPARAKVGRPPLIVCGFASYGPAQ